MDLGDRVGGKSSISPNFISKGEEIPEYQKSEKKALNVSLGMVMDTN